MPEFSGNRDEMHGNLDSHLQNSELGMIYDTNFFDSACDFCTYCICANADAVIPARLKARAFSAIPAHSHLFFPIASIFSQLRKVKKKKNNFLI